LIVGINGIGDGGVIDGNSVPGSRESIAVIVGYHDSAQAERGARLQKIPATDVHFCLSHFSLLGTRKFFAQTREGRQGK
jgi:hypothetical protein